jgi:hypothetical protein
MKNTAALLLTGLALISLSGCSQEKAREPAMKEVRFIVSGQPEKVAVAYSSDEVNREVTLYQDEDKTAEYRLLVRSGEKVILVAIPIKGKGWLDCEILVGRQEASASSNYPTGCDAHLVVK